jgi:hypothetical protein
MVNKLAMAGGSIAGGAASVFVAEKSGLPPLWAGVATGGASIAASTLIKNPLAKDALFAASLGAGGLVGVQLLASYIARKAQQPQQSQQKPAEKRHADGDPVTRGELNAALSQMADKQTQACDLITALHDEIKHVISEQAKPVEPPKPTATAQPVRPTNLYPIFRSAAGDDERNAFGDDEYMRNAYGSDEERNAFVEDEYQRNAYGADEERNAFVEDEYQRNAYGGDEERNAYVEDERNAFVDEERNAGDDERNAFVEEERNAGEDERNASEEYAAAA